MFQAEFTATRRVRIATLHVCCCPRAKLYNHNTYNITNYIRIIIVIIFTYGRKCFVRRNTLRNPMPIDVTTVVSSRRRDSNTVRMRRILRNGVPKPIWFQVRSLITEQYIIF
jgi:hypothetical protein